MVLPVSPKKGLGNSCPTFNVYLPHQLKRYIDTKQRFGSIVISIYKNKSF